MNKITYAVGAYHHALSLSLQYSCLKVFILFLLFSYKLYCDDSILCAVVVVDVTRACQRLQPQHTRDIS